MKRRRQRRWIARLVVEPLKLSANPVQQAVLPLPQAWRRSDELESAANQRFAAGIGRFRPGRTERNPAAGPDTIGAAGPD